MNLSKAGEDLIKTFEGCAKPSAVKGSSRSVLLILAVYGIAQDKSFVQAMAASR